MSIIYATTDCCDTEDIIQIDTVTGEMRVICSTCKQPCTVSHKDDT